MGNLLAKGAIETVPPAQSESGFCSHYFLVPKKDGGLRPILDLRRLNHTLMRWPFRMLMLKQILSQVRPGDWFCLLDLKDAYFHIQIAPHQRRFLRFTFEGVAYQYTVLPFGLSLAPRTFTKCMDMALSPLRQKEIRILNYLDDWLILAQLEDVLLSHRSFLLSHLDCLGLRVSFAKSVLSPSQRILFLRAVVMPECALAIQQLAALFKKILGLMASASPVLQLGLLQMRPREPESSIPHLAPADHQWMERGILLHTVCRREVVSTDASNSGWGALCDGKERNLIGQHDGSVLHKSPERAPLGMGSAQFAFAKSDTCARHPQMVQIIWEIFGKAEVDLFTPEDNSYCPTYFSKNKDVLTHEWPNLLLYTFPMVALIPQVIRRVRDQKHKVLYQYWFAELSQLLSAAPPNFLSCRSPSTPKVYVAAIAAYHAPIAGQSAGKNNLVEAQSTFPRHCPFLESVLRAPRSHPFEPLQSIGLHPLMLKTTLLLALVSVKPMGDLQVLSVNPTCLEFGPNDSKIILKPRQGYVPKVLLTLFRAQEFNLLSPTIEAAVCMLRLSKWIIEAITLAYSFLGLQCPLGVKAHSTRGVASSWAWSSGVSIAEICAAAGWALQSIFARFHSLDILGLQAWVTDLNEFGPAVSAGHLHYYGPCSPSGTVGLYWFPIAYGNEYCVASHAINLKTLRQNGHLYSQIHRPLWQILAGFVAIAPPPSHWFIL
ncbi:hypothetical protein M9458_051342 [Cirrhinus mrigala]|uniref:ribonuclease H n=1 Tax=Cirrhinus mrigala TaxID=683832 RepID=A0ABD0MXQ2_CIRMR